jgi:FKBP-type peptidyl-prolyl cis-trans isomerase FklB
MKYLPSLATVLLCYAVSMPAMAQTPAAPKTDREKLGYALGMDVGRRLKAQPLDADQNQLLAGLHDSLTGTQQLMTDDEVRSTLMAFSKQMQAKMQAQRDAATADSAKNKAAGDAFLAANKTKPGVKTLEDGLQYKVIKDGTGPMPSATDTVTVKYKGTLIDGKVFDSSEQHGGTASFPVGGVIHGWTEALQKMKVGSQWQLFIPSALAYGDQGAGADIAPGSTLIFDVELVSIDK